MQNIPKELIFKITEYLPNYDIINIYKINKIFKTVFDEYSLMEHCLNRDHPTVFNQLDNYCYICNLKLTIICFNKDFEYITCNHY